MKCHRSLGQRSGVRFIVACSKQPRKQHSAVETVARLESLLKAKGIKIFEAKAAGLAMRPTVLLSSAIRKPGPPLINRYPFLALHLPIKVWCGNQRMTQFGL